MIECNGLGRRPFAYRLRLGMCLGLSLLFLGAAWAEPTSEVGEKAEQADSLTTAAEPERQGFALIPVLGYTPETRLVGGASIVYFFPESLFSSKARPSTTGLQILFTQNEQFMFKVFPDLYLQQDSWHVRGLADYRRYPDLFYGIGPDADSEEGYTANILTFKVSVEREVKPGLYLGGSGFYAQEAIDALSPGGQLAGGGVRGAEGGDVSGLGVLLTWDRRDNIFSAASGSYLQGASAFHHRFLGSDFEYLDVVLDARHFRPLGRGFVAAFQGLAGFRFGEPPFRRLSLLGGGDQMRGFHEGRYRDRHLVVAQTELRTPYWKRTGMAFFTSAGEVYHSPETLMKGWPKVSAGFGFRYQVHPAQRLTIRADLAYSEEGWHPYLKLGEAF